MSDMFDGVNTLALIVNGDKFVDYLVKKQYIKFANGHYLLTTYEIKSNKLVKLIDYNFTKSSKMIDVILDWFKLR